MGLNRDTYEIWVERIGGAWSRAEDRGEDLWTDPRSAEDAARVLAEKEGVVQVIVIERKPILFLNGPVHDKAKKFKVVKPSGMIENLEESEASREESP